MSCNLCFSDTYHYISKPRINKNFPVANIDKYRIVQCSKCKLYYIEPEIELTETEWKLLYGSGYFACRETSWSKMLHSKEREERINLIKTLTPIPIRNFLDFGCGQGLVLSYAYEQGWNTFGLDIANNLISDVTKNKITFFHGNIFEANYPNDYFESIYLDSVLEHTLRPREILLEIKRILKPNGTLFLIVPNEDCLLNDFKKLLYTITFKRHLYGCIKPFVSPYHVQGFSKASLKSAFKFIGFDLRHLKDFGGKYQFFRMYPFMSINYIKELILYPIGLLSIILKRQMQLEAVVIKRE